MLARTAPSSDGPRSGPGGPQAARSTSAALPVPWHPPGFRRPTEGHRRAAAAPLPRRCPGIRQASDGPPWFRRSRKHDARTEGAAFSDGGRTGGGGAHTTRPQLLPPLAVHRGPGGPLAACSTSAAQPVPWQIAAATMPIVSELDTGAVV